MNNYYALTKCRDILNKRIEEMGNEKLSEQIREEILDLWYGDGDDEHKVSVKVISNNSETLDWQFSHHCKFKLTIDNKSYTIDAACDNRCDDYNTLLSIKNKDDTKQIMMIDEIEDGFESYDVHDDDKEMCKNIYNALKSFW